MTDRKTNTHNVQELYFLRCSLLKFTKEEGDAIAKNRACGYGDVADKQQEEVLGLVGTDGNREDSTYERITQAIAGANSNPVSFDFSPLEGHAFAVGLPKLAKRLRAKIGEEESLGNEKYAKLLAKQADHVETVLIAHYGEQTQMALGAEGSED